MKKRFATSVLTLFGAGVMLGAAAMPMSVAAQEYTNRRDLMQDEALRRDFNVQGEYLTTLGKSAESEGVKIGMHVIARGDGNFDVVGYLGGLPGDGWKRDILRTLGKAKLDGETITFDIGEARGKTPDGEEVKLHDPIRTVGKVIIERPQGGQGGAPGAGGGGGERGGFRGIPVKLEFPARENAPAMTFEKIYRQSPTLGDKAPEGAVAIFDGTNVDKFESGAKMNESQRGNTLWAEATAKPLESKPYKMHIEFMLSYMPQATGQARSNSGVYVGQMYECQVLDSFGLEGENNECGGFYQIAKPLVNMCAPPLTWQTYDIDYTPPKFDGDKKTANARVTVKHNGVVIHDNIELPNATPGCLAEGPGPRGFYLQGHGNKVQYRNIWVQY